MIRAIIIDDEPSAINVLTLLLRKKCREDVVVVATSNSPYDAKPLIEQHKPDLVFLDIEMPGLTGIDIVRSLDKPDFRIVFVTAYDAYAVEAFEVSAIDYLLKPVGADKVVKVINKIKDDIERNEGSTHNQLYQFEKFLIRNSDRDQKIGISTADKIIFLKINEIIYCEAKGAYAIVYLKNGNKIVASKPLGEFESQLEMQGFFRIHHSFLINLNQIKEFQRSEGGYVLMENNARLEVSQRKRKDFLVAIQKLLM